MPSVTEAPILIVAALSRELEKINRTAHSGLALLETGEGVANAERHLDAWLERGTARAVLSIGFAGALSPSLQAGDLVIAREVRGSTAVPDAEILAAATRVNMATPMHLAVALTSHQIIWLAESKRSLARALGPNEIGFVDMESTAIAGVCSRRGVPFLIARSITDLLDEDLPLDFDRCRDAAGRVDPKLVMKAVLLRPVALRGLLELRKRSKLCAERMAGFVELLVRVIS